MEKIFEILKENPLFSGLAEEDIAAVLKAVGARKESKRKGEYILRNGDATSEMGTVLSGSVLVIQEDLWGRRNIMNRVSAGDIFAEVFAASAGAVLNVSVVAEEDCELLFLDVGRLLSLPRDAEAHGDTVVRSLISLLARKTLALNDKVTHISRRCTREKLLSFLSAESLRQGTRSFSIAFNRQQLADYLCVERAAMSVELSKLQKEGILRYERNHFELKEAVDR